MTAAQAKLARRRAKRRTVQPAQAPTPIAGSSISLYLQAPEGVFVQISGPIAQKELLLGVAGVVSDLTGAVT